MCTDVLCCLMDGPMFKKKYPGSIYHRMQRRDPGCGVGVLFCSFSSR
jgi:hypothetical protein